VKILYVSQYFPPEMGAPAARAGELAQHWSALGHKVTVLTGFPNHPTGVVPSEYRAKLRRLVARELVGSVDVLRTWLLPLPNRKAHERILNYSSFFVSSAIAGLSIPRPDVVIATSPQLLVALSGYWLAHVKRVPFVFEVRDLWPESLIAVNQANEKSALHRSLAGIAAFLYRRSDHIVVVTPAFKDHLISKWCVPPQKVSVVTNGVETEMFSPSISTAAADEQLRTANIETRGRFVISYIGTMGMAHGLKTVLAAARNLQHTLPEALFLLIGEGAEKANIQSLAERWNLRNVHLLDQQPRERIPSFIRKSDAALVLLKKSELFKTVIPSKILEFMACACPIILGVDGQARSIVEAAHAGIFIEPENHASLAAAIVQLAKHPILREELGQRGREHIVRHFARGQTAKSYVSILESLLEKVTSEGPTDAHVLPAPVTAQQ
jgi:colanic acid biosynthesis glycosyl transferase WcaI